jgi:hypothetical protein
MTPDEFERADTVDAFPRLTEEDLDAIAAGRRRKERRQRHGPWLRAAWSAALVVVVAAGGIAAYNVAGRHQTGHRAAAHLAAAKPGGAAHASHHVPAVTVAPSATPTPAQVVIYTCEGLMVTQPTAYTLACADGNGGVSGLTWSIWGVNGASATGQYYENSCAPDCADGTFIYTPATVTLSDPLASQDGGEYFTSLTVSTSTGTNTWQLGPDGPDMTG